MTNDPPDPADLSIPSSVSGDDLPELSESLICGQASDAARRMQERLERELHGAWRAGFDYLHVYDEQPDLSRGSLAESVAMAMYVLPACRQRPPTPDGLVYRYSYDLQSVPDAVIRQAVRGELDPDDWREVADE